MNYLLTYSLTAVRCRATSVAKKHHLRWMWHRGAIAYIMDGIGLYFIGKLGVMRYIVVQINKVMKLCINALTPVIQNIPRTDKLRL